MLQCKKSIWGKCELLWNCMWTMIGCDGGEIMRKIKKRTKPVLGISFGHIKEKREGVIY